LGLDMDDRNWKAATGWLRSTLTCNDWCTCCSYLISFFVSL
jgi:hypothetical protein